jgi:hypothetical protein
MAQTMDTHTLLNENIVEDGSECDFCSNGAIFRFRVMKWKYLKSRWALVDSGRWLCACAIHWQKALRLSKGEVHR